MSILCSSLCGVCVLLSQKRLSSSELGILEDYYSISENEIHCTKDFAIPVKLSPRQCIKSVLVTLEAATIKDEVISTCTKCNCLMTIRSCFIPECQIFGHESNCRNSYSKVRQFVFRQRRFSGNHNIQLPRTNHRTYFGFHDRSSAYFLPKVADRKVV